MCYQAAIYICMPVELICHYDHSCMGALNGCTWVTHDGSGKPKHELEPSGHPGTGSKPNQLESQNAQYSCVVPGFQISTLHDMYTYHTIDICAVPYVMFTVATNPRCDLQLHCTVQ